MTLMLLSVIHAECRFYCYAECRYAECRYAEWIYAECLYIEGHGSVLRTFPLSCQNNIHHNKTIFYFVVKTEKKL
jgi:hypothetical protein